MQGRWINVSFCVSLFGEAAYLIFLEAVLENVLHYQRARLTESNLMPHSTKSLIDILHDLRRGLTPAKFKQLLPDVTSIPMDDSLRDTTKKLMNHDRLVVFRNRVKRLLHDMAAKCIHGEIQGVASDGFSNLDDLLGSSVLKAALNQEVSEAVDHQWISLSDNRLNNVILLLGCADLELLLQEDRSLLIIVANDLVNNVLPVAVNSAVKKTAVVEWLSSWQVSLALSGNSLNNC